MSAGLGFQEHSGEQQAQSQSGVDTAYRGRMSEDAYNQSTLSRDLSTQYARSPFGYFQNQAIRSLIPQGQYGLPIQMDQAIGALGNSWWNKASAGGAMRGQLTPENTNQIVGSSMLNASQWLAPYIMDNQRWLATLPDELASKRMGYLQADQQARANLLSPQSQSSGSQYGYGVQMSGGVGGVK